MPKPVLRLLLPLILLVGLSSCAALKNSKLARAYHNISAHYNGYYNAKEIMLAAEAKLFDAHKENFNAILPIFIVPEESMAKTMQADMDVVIKKCARVIKKHPKSNWEDDCFLLIGKAYFYKRDFFAAKETFEYIAVTWPNTETARLAQLWVVQALIELEKLPEAQNKLSAIANNTKMVWPEKLNPERYLTEAAYYLETGEHAKAKEALQKSLPDLKVKKKYKTRYYFTLAELEQRLGNNDLANDYYKTVIKRNPPYDLSFQSKLRLAEVATGEENIAAVRGYLYKLTRDDKNLEYFDQIYYTLAKLDTVEGKTPQALGHLNESVRNSTTNSNQKARSYLMLGDLHFAERNYRTSKSYYDSASKFLAKDFPGYEDFVSRQSVLSELIENLITYETQDSLLAKAKLPRDSLDNYIRWLQKEDQRRQIEEQNRQQSQQQPVQNPDNLFNPLNDPTQPPQQPSLGNFNLRQGASPWDDPVLLKQGEKAFVERWGRRPQQDHWRRFQEPIQKQTEIQDNDTSTALTDNSDVQTPAPPTNVPADLRAYYEKLPLTPVSQNVSHIQIQDALYKIGNIYYTQLRELDKAQQYYEMLLTRYPDNKYLLNVWYNLYSLHKDRKEDAKAQVYAQKILDKFPESDLALLLRDPEAYGQKFVKRNQNPALENLYETTYNHYKSGNCMGVINGYNAASGFDENYLAAKFDFLRVLCLYRDDTTGIFDDTLMALAMRHPGTDIAKQAKDLAEVLQKKKTPQPNGSSSTTVPQPSAPATPYKFNPNNAQYHIVILHDADRKKLIEMATRLSTLNRDFFADQNLELNSNLLLEENKMILVRNFSSKEKAANYLDRLNKDLNMFEGVANHKQFFITDENLKLLMSSKDVEGYMSFFSEHYL